VSRDDSGSHPSLKGEFIMRKKNTFVLSMLLAVGVLLPGFALAQNYPATVGQLVATTKKDVGAISMADLKAAVDRGEAGIIVDVREPSEFADGHVAGAVNVPRGLIEFNIWTLVGFPDKIDTNTKLTLYCKTGGRAALAAKSLRALGFTNVIAVDMKIDEWMKAGYPTAS
jgi:rhodanese-related sulfurtransferase